MAFVSQNIKNKYNKIKILFDFNIKLVYNSVLLVKIGFMYMNNKEVLYDKQQKNP